MRICCKDSTGELGCGEVVYTKEAAYIPRQVQSVCDSKRAQLHWVYKEPERHDECKSGVFRLQLRSDTRGLQSSTWSCTVMHAGTSANLHGDDLKC